MAKRPTIGMCFTALCSPYSFISPPIATDMKSSSGVTLVLPLTVYPTPACRACHPCPYPSPSCRPAWLIVSSLITPIITSNPTTSHSAPFFLPPPSYLPCHTPTHCLAAIASVSSSPASTPPLFAFRHKPISLSDV